jgi:SAM-dependent methyltransferase
MLDEAAYSRMGLPPPRRPVDDSLQVVDQPAPESAELTAPPFLFTQYIQTNARRLVGRRVRRMLVLGCGAGQVAQVLRQVWPRAALVGIDRDAAALEQARQTTPAVPAPTEFITGDMQAELPPGPFDLVYGAVPLSYIKYPARVLELAFGALAPGGTLWLREPRAGIVRVLLPAAGPAPGSLVEAALTRLGAHAGLANDLPGLLAAAGFARVQSVPEAYSLAGTPRSLRRLPTALMRPPVAEGSVPATNFIARRPR